jgi:hypothetical protein
MPTIWVHNVHVICASASMPGAIAALDIAFPCDDGMPRDLTHPERYGCALSVDGNEPATHYGASFSVTEEIRQRLESLGLAQTPGVSYWRCSNPDGVLESSNWPGQQVGMAFGFDDATVAMALKRVIVPYPI